MLLLEDPKKSVKSSKLLLVMSAFVTVGDAVIVAIVCALDDPPSKKFITSRSNEASGSSLCEFEEPANEAKDESAKESKDSSGFEFEFDPMKLSKSSSMSFLMPTDCGDSKFFAGSSGGADEATFGDSIPKSIKASKSF